MGRDSKKCMGYILGSNLVRDFLIEMEEWMVNRGEGIPQRHNTNEVLMMCVDEQ